MDYTRRLVVAWMFQWLLVAVGALTAVNAQAVTQDITSQFTIARGGLGLNRTTGTYDQLVTIKNGGSAPVLGAINVVVSGLPSAVTLANATGVTPDGKPYVTPLAAGATLLSGNSLSFTLRFNNPQRTSFPSVLQVLYSYELPPGAPNLLAAVATGGTNAYLIGRLEGAGFAGRDVALQVSSAATCVLGTLVSGATVGAPIATTTDPSGYFGVTVPGVAPGTFVAIKATLAPVGPSPVWSPSSACLVSSRDNDSWPKAFPLDGSTASITDLIDAPGKARWYKFAVTPGQRIDVRLTKLPADYDLAVFRDIGQVFASQFTPGPTAVANDLLKLTAEYAPTVFSPTVFSPTVFSPTVFSPDAYAPTVFSPTVFSPTVFSPTVFSPTVFSPTVFSPTVFSPTVFSPTVFSPTVFSPTVFSPTVFSQQEIAQAFSTAQTRSVIAVSATPGTGDELAVVNTWNRTGNFYVRVTGRGGAFNTSTPFTLGITKGLTTCTGVTDTTLTSRSTLPASGLKTVIVTDSSKVALDSTLPGPEILTLRDKLAAFAARSEVLGVLVDVKDDTRVKALRQQAAANPACPFAKNLVAEEIKGIIDSYRANPLRYVVLAGNDDAIPFFRSPDQTDLGRESGYVPPVQSNSPSEASLRLDFVLSQDRYGSKTTISLPWNDFPVPGLAVGRLVESATEIAGLIDAYTAGGASIVPTSTLVTGYDFLQDAANAVKGELDAGTGAGAGSSAVSDALITPNGKSPQDPASWKAADLRAKLFGSRHDVIFLAGHFSANSALAADFATSVLTTDLVASTTDFTNAIIFSAGCHAGYNLVDVDAIPGVTLPLDWAQAFSRKKATLIAGTGYQYGDTDFLEYSERLYKNFAQQLRAGLAGTAVAVGEALVQAKLAYLAATPDIRGLHEKALLESTLFGLPMLGVNMPSGRGTVPGIGAAISPTPVAGPSPAATLGLRTRDIGVAPALSPHTQTLKNLKTGADVVTTWLSGPDGVVSKGGEPVLPLAVVNVTPDDSRLVLRGIGYRGGSFVDSSALLPFTGAPTTETRGVHVPFLSPVQYPTTMWTPNYFGALAGNGGTQLLVTPVQHRVASAVNGTSIQRRHTAMNLRLFYSGNLSQAALSDAPVIVRVDAQPDAGGVAFTVQVVGDPAAAIYQAWITYTGTGNGGWSSLDLDQCVRSGTPSILPVACGATEDSRLWKGRLATAPANLQFFAQAVNGVGLVSRNDNLGAYFTLVAPTPTATAMALVSPPSSATVGANIDITAKLAYASGVAIGGKLVSVGVGGVSQLGTTASNGLVTVKMPVVATAGAYQITAAFAGDDVFQPSSIASPVTILKAAATPTPVSASVASAGVNVTAALGGTTTAPQQVPVAFTVTGPSGTTTIFAFTDNLGNAVLPPPSGLPAGTYTVTQATFGGDGTFAPTTIALSQTFTVPALNQSITFGTLPNKAFGAPAFQVSATASSGLPVAFGASGACSVAGNLVQISGVGGCTITASQAGDTTFPAASPVARSFTIAAANQTITFGPAPIGLTVGQMPVTVNATSSSTSAAPSAAPIILTSSTTTVCLGSGINSLFVVPIAQGTCTITATQAGDANYVSAAPATLSFPVGPVGTLPQTYTVTALADTAPGSPVVPGSLSLRQAIAQANSNPGADIIDLTGVSGTILLTFGQIQISGPLTINGPGADVLTINGNANGRIFSIFATDPTCPALDGPDYLVYINGLRLTNAHRNVAGSNAGAIFTEHSLLLDSMIIDNNIARGGGGVAMFVQYPGQVLEITNSQFLNNTATELLTAVDTFPVAGGGLYVVQRCQNAQDIPYTKPVTVNIVNSEFRGNMVLPLTTHDGRGGAIRSYSLADITIIDTLITDNHVVAPNPPVSGYVYNGGGFDGTAKSILIVGSEISENTAYDATAGDVTRSGGLHLANSSIDRQTPDSAMGVRIVNSTISGNVSSATAGALLAFGNMALELDNVTVADNVAAASRTGGVVLSLGATYPPSASNTARPTLRLVSSILANNSSTGGDVAASTSNFGSLTLSAAHSLVERICPTPSCTIFVTGTANILGADPMLGPLSDNGGLSRTHALLPGSPAINAGSNPFGLTTDQRGDGFPRTVGAGTDIGAFESAPP